MFLSISFIETICFNYLQQRFYLVEPTMKSLASGTNCESIYKLLKVTIDTHQQLFAEALMNSEGIEDIAEKVSTRKSLYAVPEEKKADDIQES